MLSRDQHRHEPDTHRQQQRHRTQQPAQSPFDYRSRLPMRAARERVRDQHQQRQETHALGDDAETAGRPTDSVPFPIGTQQAMAQKPIQPERRKEAQGRIDLRLPRLPKKLHGEQQSKAGSEPHLAIPEPATQVIDQHRASGGSEQRGQQKRPAHRPRDREQRGHDPEKQRRLIGVDVSTDSGNEPLMRCGHIACDQCKARLVRRPRIAQPDAGRNEHQQERGQPQQIETFFATTATTRAKQRVQQVLHAPVNAR